MTKKNNTMNTTSDGLAKINPITANQEKAFKAWAEGNNLVLSGSAGTGKTFIALYLALEDMLKNPHIYKRVIILRSIVPTRDIGFLPGDYDEKKEMYTSPYKGVCNELFGFDAAYTKLVASKKILFETTSFIRGNTYNNAIIVVDEMQNLSWHELASVMTRAGKDCKFIFCGDYAQTDFRHKDEKEGLHKFLNVVEQMRLFRTINFGWDDIVRSDMVRDFIITTEILGY